ncbi:MFS family permease [Bradyrhizobium embrapense]
MPLYGLAAVAGGLADGPSFVATTIVIAQAVMILASIVGMHAAERRNYWIVLLLSFLALPVRGVLAFFLSGWWGVVPVQILDGVGAGLQSVAVPGMVARSLNGTGRINLGQGAVITIQGIGASLSPALGGWVAQWLGYGPAFLVLGGLGLLSVAIWVAFRPTVQQY